MDEDFPEHMAKELRRMELVVYLDDDAQEQVTYRWLGEPVSSIAQQLGYLEAAKLMMWQQAVDDE